MDKFLEPLKKVFTNPALLATIIVAIIGAGAVIIAAIIGNKKKEEKKAEPPVIVIPSQEKTNEKKDGFEGIVNGIEIVGAKNMNEMPIGSKEYLLALATQGEMLKNKETVFEVYKEES